jgi:pyruvate,water dikinase
MSEQGSLELWLQQEGISSISLNPDSVIETWRRLAL